jgi:hypothetical protein
LTNADPATLATLANDLNNGDKFRIVITPGDSTVAASFEGFFTDTTSGLFEDPILGINYSAPSIGVAPPVVTATNPGNTFARGGSPVAIDAGVTVTSSDADITGATVTISNFVSGDTLSYTPVSPISISSNTGGVLTLTGNATPAQYQAALRSVTFSTTATSLTPRSIGIVALDSNDTGNVPSNSGSETVNVSIAAPVVTANQTSVSVTAGASVKVDAAATVTSADATVTGAVITITNFVTGDTLSYTPVSPISISGNTGGVLTLTGTGTAAQYQTALQSISFTNTTNNSLTTRSITMVVKDAGDTGNTNSNTASTQILVSAPIIITGAYVSSTAWNSTFLTYLAGHTNAVTGHAYGSSTLGYALETGSTAIETKTLPWTNMNQISVVFSGLVHNITTNSLELNGGTGGTTPTVTGVTTTTVGGNTVATWTLGSALTNNKYVFGVASTGSTFSGGTNFKATGTPALDANGDGIAGQFTEGQNFPSGTSGLAGSTFSFFFDVLPGDINQDANLSSLDINAMRPLASGTHSNSASYNPYFDTVGDANINSTEFNAERAVSGHLASNSPTAPSASGGIGTTDGSGFMALGVQETGSSSSTSTPAVANVNSTSTGSTSTTSSTSTTPANDSDDEDTGSAGGSSQNAATDAAVADFDLADLYV